MSSKLREALSKASIALSWASHHHLTEDDAKACLEVVDAALALPPRNYDIFRDHEEAWVAYKRIAPNGGYFDAMTLWDFIKWLFAETEVGSDEK